MYFKIYSSILELDDETIYISAVNEQEFKKKEPFYKIVKEEILNQISDNIDNLAYEHTSGLYEYTRIKKIKY